MDITKRTVIYIGFKCNARCTFCYYLSQTNDDNFPLKSSINRIAKYRKYGMKELDITGGEPTMLEGIDRLIVSAKTLGYENIRLITNGTQMGNTNFIDYLLKCGVTSFIFSLHGSCEETHDKLTVLKGSYKLLIEAMNYLKEKNVRFLINVVVNKLNLDEIESIAELAIKYNPIEVTFLVLNPMEDASKQFQRLSTSYTNIVPHLTNAIKNLNDQNILTSWKFMPLCLAPEIEQNCSNGLQLFLRSAEWNHTVEKLEKGIFQYLKVILGYFKTHDRALFKHNSFKTLIYMSFVKEHAISVLNIKKLEKCNDCRFKYVCTGIAKNYLDVYGDNEVRPVKGDLVWGPYNFYNQIERVTILDRLKSNILYAISSVFSICFSK